jgi:hypothetical protein
VTCADVVATSIHGEPAADTITAGDEVPIVRPRVSAS